MYSESGLPSNRGVFIHFAQKWYLIIGRELAFLMSVHRPGLVNDRGQLPSSLERFGASKEESWMVARLLSTCRAR